jgi:hypothetical protein
MHYEGGNDQLAVADFINEYPTEHDAEAETGEACSTDRTKLGAGEIELGSPGAKEASANAKSDSGGENSSESSG